MELRQLRCFVAVAEELHFGRAALRIGISQPPLSDQIRNLETRLGLRLFERTRRRVELTAAGRILLDEARKLIDHAERVAATMKAAASGRTGDIHLGAVPTALYGVMPRLTEGLKARGPAPGILVREAHTAEILEAVRDHRFDVGLVWEDEVRPPLRIRPLERVEFIAALPAAHALANADRISLKDLAADTLIVPPRTVTPHQFDRIVDGFRKLSIEPSIGAEVRSVPSQLGYVVSGFGIALVPRYATALAPIGVVFKTLQERFESTPLSLVWSELHLSPQIAAFIDLVAEIFPLPDPSA